MNILEQRKIARDRAITLSHHRPSVVFISSGTDNKWIYNSTDLEHYIIDVQNEENTKICSIYIKGEVLSTEPY